MNKVWTTIGITKAYLKALVESSNPLEMFVGNYIVRRWAFDLSDTEPLKDAKFLKTQIEVAVRNHELHLLGAIHPEQQVRLNAHESSRHMALPVFEEDKKEVGVYAEILPDFFKTLLKNSPAVYMRISILFGN